MTSAADSLNSQTDSGATPPQSAVIVGAGVAGLAAAIRLKERGVNQVVVLEKADRPGGLAISLHYEGVSTDLGPHRLFTLIPEVERFYREIAGEAIIEVQRRSRMYIEKRFIAYPPSIADLLRGPGPFRLAHFGISFAWARVVGALGRLDRGSYDGYMRAAFGSALYEYLLGPYTRKVWKCDPSNLDAEAARVRVSAGSLAKMVRNLFPGGKNESGKTSLKKFSYVKGGAETLVRLLAEKAESLGARILLNHEADGFEISGGRIGAVKAQTPNGPEVFPADRVISTSPLPELANVLNGCGAIASSVAELASSLRYLDMILVSVIVKREIVSGDSWLYFPGEELVINRAYEAKAFDPGMGESGRSVLCAEITCRPGQGLWTEKDETIASTVVNELASTGLFEAREVHAAHVHRLQYAYPVYSQGYGEKLDQILAGLSSVENLITTGRQGLFNFNNMDHSIYMGLRAAECAAANDKPARRWIAENEAFRNFRIID
jgi:protoporphyrinogen oxidase